MIIMKHPSSDLNKKPGGINLKYFDFFSQFLGCAIE